MFKWIVSVIRISEKIIRIHTTPFKWMPELKGVGCLMFF